MCVLDTTTRGCLYRPVSNARVFCIGSALSSPKTREVVYAAFVSFPGHRHTRIAMDDEDAIPSFLKDVLVPFDVGGRILAECGGESASFKRRLKTRTGSCVSVYGNVPWTLVVDPLPGPADVFRCLECFVRGDHSAATSNDAMVLVLVHDWLAGLGTEVSGVESRTDTDPDTDTATAEETRQAMRAVHIVSFLRQYLLFETERVFVMRMAFWEAVRASDCSGGHRIFSSMIDLLRKCGAALKRVLWLRPSGLRLRLYENAAEVLLRVAEFVVARQDSRGRPLPMYVAQCEIYDLEPPEALLTTLAADPVAKAEDLYACAILLRDMNSLFEVLFPNRHTYMDRVVSNGPGLARDLTNAVVQLGRLALGHGTGTGSDDDAAAAGPLTPAFLFETLGVVLGVARAAYNTCREAGDQDRPCVKGTLPIMVTLAAHCAANMRAMDADAVRSIGRGLELFGGNFIGHPDLCRTLLALWAELAGAVAGADAGAAAKDSVAKSLVESVLWTLCTAFHGGLGRLFPRAPGPVLPPCPDPMVFTDVRSVAKVWKGKDAELVRALTAIFNAMCDARRARPCHVIDGLLQDAFTYWDVLAGLPPGTATFGPVCEFVSSLPDNIGLAVYLLNNIRVGVGKANPGHVDALVRILVAAADTGSTNRVVDLSFRRFAMYSPETLGLCVTTCVSALERCLGDASLKSTGIMQRQVKWLCDLYEAQHSYDAQQRARPEVDPRVVKVVEAQAKARATSRFWLLFENIREAFVAAYTDTTPTTPTTNLPL